MVVLLLNGLAAVWAVWFMGGERQRTERSEKAEQCCQCRSAEAECVKTDSLKKGRGCQAGLRTLEAQKMRSRVVEEVRRLERNSTFSFRFHCFRFVPFVCIID